ncbi:microtubule-associated serine/threonine-protein kinase 4-like isoform X1 [Ranitomeya variabilis]|uniref:microtubule-associated serine/threonine-protein kinase 4-like isoform X1 n=1 Tax=Ranitomeya variabilis TaxID=490064 RepID=UPI004055DA1B
MAGILLEFSQLKELLMIVINNRSNIELLPPDGVLSFTRRLVMQLVKDCLKKHRQHQLTSEYLTDLCYNIRTLLHQAEERSQTEDLAFFKELAGKVLSILEPSLERPETPRGDAKCGENVTPETPDPNRSQPEPSSDLMTEPSALANPDSGICEIPEIQESAGGVIKSLIPARKPHMSDYETSKLISSGHFGSVHLVRHKDSQQIFAMKKMAKRNLNTLQNVEWAYLERDIQTFADCPFVVSMLCSFPTRSHLCMVMEYVGGGDCGTLLSTRGTFSVPLARMYFAEVLLAVEYLHSYGVVHRDLKPDNLMITPAGHIKVTDFGLSKVGLMIPKTNNFKESAEDIAREYQDREFCGTPCYIAPEVILKEGYGRTIDWWAMGIILHEFLLGSIPFDADTLTELYKTILFGEIVWECDRAPPLDAQNLITELLRKNPVHRLGTGGAFQIKNHPFLSDLDFNNLLSQKPEYVPQLLSDMDTSCFINHSDINKHLVSEDEGTSENNDSLDFQNYTSSSEKLCKLCTTTTSMVNIEDPKSPPECTPASSTIISEMQQESVPVINRDDAISILPSSFPLSDPSDKSKNLVSEDEEGKSENEENVFFLKVTSSERISKHSTTTNVTMNVEDSKSPPECTAASNTDISEMQKESVSVSDRDNAVTILPSSSPLSDHSDKSNHLVSEDDEGKNENEENVFFLKITSSESISKHSTTTNGTLNNEDPKSPPECTTASNTDISEMQKESVPVSDRDDVITILPSSPSLSESQAQEDRKSVINLSTEQQNSENEKKGKKRRRSIFRRFLSSCRRGISRAARLFACCHCCPRTI